MKKYPKQNIMGAFGLLPIYKFEIKEIEPAGKDTFEVTVVIYEKKTRRKMKDIMKWRKTPSGWENSSYKEVVNNLIKDVVASNEKVEEKILMLNKCKTQVKYLSMLVWEYCNEKKISLDKFKSVRPDLWLNLLEQSGSFANEPKPRCPFGGVYTVTYDEKKGNIVVKCSKHSSVSVPYKFAPKEK